MYGFVDTIESAPSTLMSIQTIFNNLNLDKDLTDDNGSFRTLVVNGRGDVEYDINTIGINGMHGTWEEKTPRRKLREISINFQLKTESNLEMNQKLNKLRSMLTGSKKELEFTDEEVIYYATLQSLELPEEDSNDLIGTINFLCSDPDKYGEEETLETSSDTFIVENTGTTDSDPIFELTAKEKTTFAMVANGTDEDSEYNLIGFPADDDVEIVDTKTSILYENGSTLDTWQTATNQLIDETRMHKITGTMGTDDAGIRASNYGTGDKLHGPAIYKEITPIRDFEIESTFDVISRREEENWRMGINFLDENMNMLGHLGLKDNSRNHKRRVPLGRFGAYRGGGRANGNLIGDADRFDNAREITLFYLRVKREGNAFTFYIAEWMNQRHIKSWSRTYRDNNNSYGGRLKYITLYISKWGSRPNPSRIRINSVEVFELSQATVDQTPYILYPGDKVTFDHKDDDILVNGEPRNDLKDFGGSFFKLKKGYNNLLVYPDGAFETKVTHRNKYL